MNSTADHLECSLCGRETHRWSKGAAPTGAGETGPAEGAVTKK
ncbi:MAG: hypothetical protein ACYTG0_46925 [Planctomycetota bacterium]|jgi:hypothetical protein